MIVQCAVVMRDGTIHTHIIDHPQVDVNLFDGYRTVFYAPADKVASLTITYDED